MSNRSGILFLILALALALAVGLTAAVGAEENLLLNGGFEEPNGDIPMSWAIDYWQATSTYAMSSAKAHSGKYSLEIKSDTANDARMIQTVGVSPDTFYRLSGWIAVKNVAAGKVGANLCVMGQYNYSTPIEGTADWTYAELNFRTHSSQDRVVIGARLGMYCNEVSGTAYFDDLSLVRLDSAPPSYQQLGGNEPAQSAGQTASGKSGGGWIWLVAIGAAVIVLVNVFFYKKRKPAGGEPPSDDNPPAVAGE
ncbi:MAG: carbohydrate binding domain-containing protein [Bacteroidota bacterium]